VPPQYSYAQPLINLKNGTSVYKASSRLAWTSTPTAALLEGANPDNIPVVQYAVPFNPLTDAPLAVATWSITLGGSTQPSATGDLWASGSNATALLYDLPLSANLIPALASLGGPATLAVTLTLVDAAGNEQTQSGGTFTFHVVGPPLAISEDTTYAATADLRSTHPYRITDLLYAQLFQNGAPAFLPENTVRLIRYRVTNPSSAGVALTLPAVPGGWSAKETWTEVRVPTGPASADCGDPFGDAPVNASPTVGTGDLVSFAYNQAAGIDTFPAQKTPSGQVIVPPAGAGSPGVLTLFVARPLPAGSRTFPLPWNGSKFSIPLGLKSEAVATGAPICCEFDPLIKRCVSRGRELQVTTYSSSQDLTASSEVLVGTFPLVTQGLSGTTVVGEPSTSPTAVTVTRTIPH